jgi:threonine/homoserine/homoserine lactone efflux protein
MNWHTLAIFAVTSCVLSMTPGPNMLMAMSFGLRFGTRRAVWGGVGMCLALAMLATLSSLGLGALLATSAPAFETVKWAGVAYLAWLGFKTWRAPVEPASAGNDVRLDGEGRPIRLMVRGFLVAVSNPKALVFMAALFPQFIDTTAPLPTQLAWLITVMVVMEFGWIMAYASGGHSLAARLSSTRAARSLNRMTGALMIAAGGLLSLAKRV